jgi:tetratricopeptide (TPR) repeat protein
VGDLLEGLEPHRQEARAALDPSEPDPAALDAALDRALATGTRFAGHHRRLLDRLIELESSGGPQRALLMARNQTRRPADEVVPVLVQMAVRHRLRDREACRQWAELALERAEAELPETDGYRARAWAEVANAQRIFEEYPAARRSFHRALELLEAEGGRDPAIHGEIYSLLASLENALHRPEQALEWLDRAAKCFRRARLPADLRKVEQKRANVKIYQGRFREAYADLEQVLSSVTESADSLDSQEPLLSVCHDTLGLLTEVALTTASEAEKRQILAGYVESLGDLVDLYANGPAAWRTRRSWMTGRLLMAEQRLDASRRCFKFAMQEFLELEQPTAAAVVALDLALAYAREGKVEQVREVASAACTALKASGLAPGVWAAHRALLDCDVSALETTIVDGLKRLRGASLRRTPEHR